MDLSINCLMLASMKTCTSRYKINLFINNLQNVLHHRFKYVVIFDIDEIIVPMKADNWADMMMEISNLKSGRHIFVFKKA